VTREFTYYGVELSGFPGFPGLEPTHAAPSIASVAWTAASGRPAIEGQPLFSERSSGLAMGWDGYARYDLTFDGVGGSVEVTMDTIDVAEAARGFLFSVLPVALPLVGLEPLHSAAVAVDGHVTLLLGESGSGKSSVASAMADLGHCLVCDDACAIDEQLNIWPGPPLVTPRWRGSRMPQIGTYNGKSMLAGRSGPRDPVPIERCVVLTPVEGSALNPTGLSPRQALRCILQNIRHPWAFGEVRRERQLQVAAGLSRGSCIRLTFDPRRDAPDAIASVVDALSRG
jgi:hypothetical protein